MDLTNSCQLRPAHDLVALDEAAYELRERPRENEPLLLHQVRPGSAHSNLQQYGATQYDTGFGWVFVI